VRARAHSYEGYSSCGGLLVDVEGLRQFEVVKRDNETLDVTVGPGVRQGYVYYHLWFDHKAWFNGGSEHSVGMGGITLQPAEAEGIGAGSTASCATL